MVVNIDFKIAYDILHDIYVKGAYSTIKMNEMLEDIRSRDRIVRIVYGVLDRDIELDYYINHLSAKRPKVVPTIILKIALYCIIYMDGMPDYAVVDNAVELCRAVGKNEYKGYVNALLKNFIATDYIPMPKNEKERMSIELSKPLWLVKALVKQYGKDKAIAIMSAESDSREHIRPNTRRISYKRLLEILRENKIEYTESGVGGVFVTSNAKIRELFNKGIVTMQGASSMLAVNALDVQPTDNVLDLCSAPGGKGVYMSERLTTGHVLALELHEHRVELIKSYIRRMHASNITAECNDAMVYRADLEGQFDRVLVDAPCSGLGIMHKKGDILLGKSMDDVNALSEIQYAIMNNAIRYVKSGGYIVYSTCTILREENYNIIGRLLKERDDIELVPIDNISIANSGSVQILQGDRVGLDGFFIAKLRKR